MRRDHGSELSRWLAGGLVLGLLVASCGHARTVGPPAGGDTSAAPAKGDDKEAKRAADARGAEGEARAEPRPATRVKAHETETGLPLASSAAGLLKPGAAEMIQQRLSQSGELPEERQSGRLDPATRAALSRYQQSHDLPATGEPDIATVEKLGLKAADIFKAGTGP